VIFSALCTLGGAVRVDDLYSALVSLHRVNMRQIFCGFLVIA
jgi:hypothetical protein